MIGVTRGGPKQRPLPVTDISQRSPAPHSAVIQKKYSYVVSSTLIRRTFNHRTHSIRDRTTWAAREIMDGR